MEKYIKNKWKGHETGLSVGGYIEPDSFMATTYMDTYYVNYYYAGGGVIAYDYYKVTDSEQVEKYVKNALGLVVIAGCSYAIFQSGGALAPLLFPIAAQMIGG